MIERGVADRASAQWVDMALATELGWVVGELEELRTRLHEDAGRARRLALAAADAGECRAARRWRAVLVDCDLAARALLTPIARVR